MNEELPTNLRPSEVREDDAQLVEEVVSPIQPPKSKFTWHAVSTTLVILVAVGLLGYLTAAGKSALQLQVKVANAPGDVIAGLQMPVHTPANVNTEPALPAVIVNPYQPSLVQPPAAVIDETAPTPRISSTYTNEPSIVTKPTPPAKVAGTNRQLTPARTYVSPHGFSLRVPAGSTVQEIEQGRVVIVNAKGQALTEVTVLPEQKTFIPGVPAELALSPSISNIQLGVLDGNTAYFYTLHNTAKGARIMHGSNVYYITDYSGNILSTFALR